MPPADAPDPTRWLDLNLAWWEERAPIHEQSDFYRSGRTGLEAFEWDDLGPVADLDIVHTQCHIGTDAISLAVRGARTFGLDFSANAIAAAARMAEAAGVAERTEWVVGDVHDAAAAVGGRTFNLVYTGKGALCWLPDMDRWAAVMWSLCRPGGRLYVSEFHPVQDILCEDRADFERSYFRSGGDIFEDAGSYADPDAATEHNVIVDFVHPLSEVVQALLDVGFELELMREFPFTLFERFPFLEEREERVWYMPSDRPEIPLMYSLRLSRPG